MFSPSKSSARLAELLRNERLAMAEFLLALAEFDRDRGWAQLGHASLFAYLQRELHLPAGPAFYRMTAARLVQEYPEVTEPLRDGRLCLSTVAEVSKVLTRDNVTDVLPRFFGASKQEAKQIAVELSPQPVPTRTVVVPLTAPPRACAGTQRSVLAEEPAATARAGSDLFLPEETPPATLQRAPAPAPVAIEPRTAELSRIHLTVTRRLLDKLAAARDALSHARPNATDDELIEAGLDLLLERAAKRRGLVRSPRATPTPTPAPTPTPTSAPGPTSQSAGVPSSHIPAHVKRAVWERDGGCCTFPLASGGVCGSRVRVELDHAIPRALGGESTVDNLRLRCRWHNLIEARRALGDAVVDRYAGGGRVRPAGARR